MSDWKFTDPPTLATFALADILAGDAPILLVHHDVEGDWQFLDGEPLGGRPGQLVSLQDIFDIDPSIARLADLPLAWQAVRSDPSGVWMKEPTYPQDWDDLVAAAEEYTQRCQDRLTVEFRMGSWERFDCDQQTSRLTWSSRGRPSVHADVRFVGSLSLTSNTWLWSWANSHILESARRGIDWLGAFGEENEFERLIQPKWTAEAVDAWQMAWVACFLLRAEGVYRAPGEAVHTFMILDDVRWAA